MHRNKRGGENYLLFVNNGHPVLDKWKCLISCKNCLALALFCHVTVQLAALCEGCFKYEARCV